MSALSIRYEGHRATITLTQPEVRNAFSDEVIAEITAAFREVGAREDVRAVVLAAEGPAFCAGANLNWMRRMADYTREENLADAGKLAEMLRVIYECGKPTIARVQGDVYAGGMGLGRGLRHGGRRGHGGLLLVRGEDRPDPRHH
ncbi:enoyl-CoA hydratase [Alicycliphilus sp. B1]|nr:enoyl-CoA hydratase [Alicycliphilus sp. B1]